MTESNPYAVVWRQRWVVVASVAVFAVVAMVVSMVLPKVYSTTTQLFVAQNGQKTSFDAVQTAQVTARTFAKLAASSNVAAEVAKRLPRETKETLTAKVSLDPVPETQLVQISAQDKNPVRAKQIADTYAETFIALQARQGRNQTTNATISLADPAPIPAAPIRPKPLLYTLLAAFFGLLAGVTLAFLRERTDRRLRSIEELEERFGLPILARVPTRRRSAGSAAAYIEAFRVMRTNLAFVTPDGPPRSISVTSCLGGEGKSSVVTELSQVTAATGTHVLVVEADLQRPSLAAAFAPDVSEPVRPGLTNLVVERAPLEAVIHPTRVPTLEWVPSGPTAPSLSGLLETARGLTAFEDFATARELVIYDCPPVGRGADAATIAGRVAGVVLVVDLKRSNRDAIASALRELKAVRARVLGFVINRDPGAGERVIETESPPAQRSARVRPQSEPRSDGHTDPKVPEIPPLDTPAASGPAQ